MLIPFLNKSSTKKNGRLYYLFVLALFFSEILLAQIPNLDSLKGKFAKADDTTKVKLLLDIGDVYVTVGKYDSALSSYFNALNNAEKTLDKIFTIRSLRQIADLYAKQNKVEMALSFSFRALKISEEQKNRRAIFAIRSQLDLIYFNNQRFNEALKYASKNLSELTPSTDKEIVVMTYMDMGDLYRELKKYDSALIFEFKAFKELKALHDKTIFAMCLNNIGNLFERQGHNDKALKYYLQAFEVSENTGSMDETAMYARNISIIFNKQKNYDQALFYANKSLKNSNDKERQKEILSDISGIYANKKEYKEAYEYMLKYDQLKDSINTTKNQNKIFELQSQHENDKKEKQITYLEKTAKLNTTVRNILVIASVLLLVILLLIARQYRLKRKSETSINLKNIALSKTLEELKSTQAQLIQSEKMASLGELTAGIAHEIQNPLNFVNNFSEVSKELLDEMKTELDNGNTDDAKELANDVIQNLAKINHHGKRADAIVKGMLQHSQSSSGVKEPTDINKLADEYLRLAYHGLRGKDNSFNVTMKTDFDETIGNINIIPQDIGRVLLNLYNNAFYAVNEKSKQQKEGYEPIVSVSTKKMNDKIEIKVGDNGPGIPQKNVDKIFQPFFTTKPTGVGTGLGLSLAYDIVKAHGGEIKVETKEGEGTAFIIQLLVKS